MYQSMVFLVYCIGISLIATNVSGSANIYSDSVQKLSVSAEKFAIDLYNEIASDPKITNIVFSPVSISAALAMTKLGARHNSSNQIDKAVYLDEIESRVLNAAFGELNGLLFDEAKSNITLKGASGAFISKNSKVLSDYKNALSMFGAQIEELDFEDSIGAVNFINAWISEQTEGLISDMLPEDAVQPPTAMILANTLYFKGDWHSEFIPGHIEDRAFYISHYKIIKTPFMYQKGKFRTAFVESLTLQILEMPYVDQEVSMIVLLPDNFDLLAVEKNLNHENLTQWLSLLEYHTVDVTFPKFKIEENLQLQAPLERLGITDIFDKGVADLSGISGDKTLYVDEIMHRGVLEVERNGGEVEAERAEAYRTAPSESKTFYADHPFIFLVRSKKDGVIHLMGALKRPAGKEASHDEL